LCRRRHNHQLRHAYAIAVARGGNNTGCRAEEERLYSTLRLLTLALQRLPDLAMIAQLMHIDEPDHDPIVLCAACDVASGALRLPHPAMRVRVDEQSKAVPLWLQHPRPTIRPIAGADAEHRLWSGHS